MRYQILWNIIQDSYLILIAAWIIAALILRKRKYNDKFMMISAVIYSAALIYITLLGRTAKSEYQMELSFLWEYRLALQGKTEWLFQILNNILLFLPMGNIYGSLKRSPVWWKAVITGACISLTIELCQLIFKLGLFEFDDILNNTIGMMVGYGFYCMLGKSDRRNRLL